MQHLNIKLFAAEPVDIDLARAIPVFHRWIQNSVLPELLIDVADYAHVPAGPGVLLIAHEANYSLDLSRDRLGLLYNRKAVLPGNAQENLRHVYQTARTACNLLEQEPEFKGRLRFRDDELELLLNDRLLYPNNEQTWLTLEPEIRAFGDQLFGKDSYVLSRPSDPRERFRVNAVKNGA